MKGYWSKQTIISLFFSFKKCRSGFINSCNKNSFTSHKNYNKSAYNPCRKI